ncbi:MAG: CRISPR-associated endoribonuclease Cas2 3 [Calditrichaeota bacterium]|nr:CRISPR-associated endoribonuclease Cas2 3 [Calditrichota bacterium]
MDVLVCYDVNTETKKGRKRLRRVAKLCQNYGQRAQKSVFECRVNPILFEQMIDRLCEIIDEEEDSLRFYRLMEPREKYQQSFGRETVLDPDKPMII